VKATMGEKVIGDGTHERAIIDVRKFKERVHS
jgi:predicted thioesterase